MVFLYLFVVASAAGYSWKLPDQAFVLGDSGFPVVLRFTHIEFTEVNVKSDESSIAYTSPHAIQARFVLPKGNLTFGWSHDDPLGMDSGTATVEFEDFTLHQSATVYQNAQGKDQIETTQMLLMVQNCEVLFDESPYSDSGNWLAKYLFGVPNEEFEVPETVTQQIDIAVNQYLLREDMSVREVVNLLQLFLVLA